MIRYCEDIYKNFWGPKWELNFEMKLQFDDASGIILQLVLLSLLH
jgi:hypothetical protein